MNDVKSTTRKTLLDTDIVSNRRAALKSMLMRTGLAAGVIVAAVTGASQAKAADRHSQTDRDTGRGSDEVNQTDKD